MNARPLSAHALAELADIAQAPVPRQSVNPGVCRRLEGDGLVECVMIPSPFPSRRGELVQHLQVTEAGRAALQ